MSTKGALVKKQSGFSALEIIMAVVIVGLLAAPGWMFYSNVVNSDESAKQDTSLATIDKKDKPSQNDTKTYTSRYLNLAFDYPSSWSVKDNPNSNTRGEKGYNHNGDKLLVASPSGYTMYFNESKPDGLGGACMPIETSDFTLFGKTKLETDSSVIGFTYEDTYYLYVSSNSTQQQINETNCRYDGLIELRERQEQDAPNIISFGNFVVSEEIVPKQKPSQAELEQAAAILLSLRKA